MGTYDCTYVASGAAIESVQWYWQWSPIPFATSIKGQVIDDALRGGWLACRVKLVDALGRARYRWSNLIYIPPANYTQPPDQMAAPTLSQVSYDQLQVTRAALPNPNGTPISSVDYRYIVGAESENDEDWIEIADIDPLQAGLRLTDLPAASLVFVQTAAKNTWGKLWSPSAVATTEAAPVVATAPLAFREAAWEMADLTTGQDFSITITELPSDGGSPLEDIVISINGGAPISIGLAAVPFTVAVNDEVLDGIGANVTIAAVNAVGIGQPSVAKQIVTSTVTPGAVANQTIEFGALTQYTAGAYRGGGQPVDAAGAYVVLTGYVSHVGGDLAGYGPIITGDGRLGFDRAGAPNGAVLRCSYEGGTVDLTVAALANTFHVVGPADLKAAAAAVPTAGNRTIIIRGGTRAMGGMGDLFKDKVFTNQVVIRGEGYNHALRDGTRSNNTAWKTICQNGQWNLLRARNVKLLGFGVHNNWTQGHGVQYQGPCVDIICENLWIKGREYDTTQILDNVALGGPWGGNINAFNCQTANGIGFSGTIRGCKIEHVYNTAYLSCRHANGWLIEGNEIYDTNADNWKWDAGGDGLAAPKEWRFNYVRAGTRSAEYKGGQRQWAHCDMGFQISGMVGPGDGGQVVSGIRCVMNIIHANEEQSYAGHHGFFSSDDGTTSTGDYKACAFADAPYIVGNFVGLGGNWHMGMGAHDRGTFAFNTTVHPCSGYRQTASNPPGISPSGKNGLGSWANALGLYTDQTVAFCNICEGTNFMSGNNNLVIGSKGSDLSYLEVFGSANTAAVGLTKSDIQTRWTPIDRSRGAFADGIGTYGTPGKPETWSFNPAFVEANRPA